jgi:hypothetical protein
MKNNISTLTRELLADEVGQLGRLLDACDFCLVRITPRAYQKAARVAEHIIKKYSLCPLILERVALSPALQELRSNGGIEKAINIGMLVLPGEVQRCLQPNLQA